jgi:hypothetical protein
MSHPVNDEILESCYEEAVENFCTSNKLTPKMFALIENHLGVQYAIDKQAHKLFESKCY